MSLLVLHDEDGRKLSFDHFPAIVGRCPDADLPLTNILASRRHCQFLESDGRLELQDLGSVNGTVVNGSPIESAILEDGDELMIGTSVFRVIGVYSTDEESPQHEYSDADRSRHGLGDRLLGLLRLGERHAEAVSR